MDQTPKYVSGGAGAKTAASSVRMLALLAISLYAIPSVWAANIYVLPTGDDAADGASPLTAFRTITHAAAQAKRGDRIVVGAGEYKEGDITPAAFGRVRFVADRRGTETGAGSGDVVVDATGHQTGFELNHNLAVTIDGFVVYGAGIGVYVKSQSDQAVVSNNIISNNATDGVCVQDSKNAVVFNNLVYNNGDSGIHVSGNVSGSPSAQVINNTVYGNGDRGIFFSGTTVSSPGGLVLNNIVQGNIVAGIQVNEGSRVDYVSAGNVAVDRFASGAPVDVTDTRQADAMFVSPAGRDGVLGGPGYADDDFHLSDRTARQTMTSPAINAGSDFARSLRLGSATTRVDGRPDVGVVDGGYHYRNFGAPPRRPQAHVRYVPLYVDPNRGSDSNDGASAATALQSLSLALQLARPGNRVVLLPGTYRPDSTTGDLTLAQSGKPGREIVVRGATGALIDATGFERGILILGASYITLDGLEIRNANASGIEIRRESQGLDSPYVSNVKVRNCHLQGNGRRGLYVYGAASVVAQSSVMEGNGSIGVEVEDGQADVTGSAVNDNAEYGLWALSGSTVSISGSAFVGNGKTGILVNQSVVWVTDSQISGSADGGARFLDSATGSLTRVTVSDITDVGVQAVSSSVRVSGGSVEHAAVGIEAIVDAGSGGPAAVTVNAARACNNQGPGVHAQDAAVTLSGTTLCDNGAEGLRQSGGSAQIVRVTATGNQQKGMAVNGLAQFELQDSVIGSNGESGVQVMTTTGPSISSCTIYSNLGNGVTLSDSPASQLMNNLIYANTSSGVVVSGNVTGSPNAQLLNNTIFGNGNRGLLIGGSNLEPASQGAAVLRNIFQANTAAGLQVNELSLPGYAGDYNLSADAYGALTPVGMHDIIADPLLLNPAGADGILGGDGAADDDFHLDQRLAGQNMTSPAVDAGGIDVVSAGLYGTTTRTDGVADSSTVDLGYHYSK